LILTLWPEKKMDARGLFSGAHASFLPDLTVISATDGNHGRGLAAAARSVGCRCVIVLHANVSAEREEAIAAYAARIVRIDGNYDASVQEAARLAKTNGWHVVSDTSYEGYEEIPRDVMQGYGTIAAEVVEALPAGAGRDAPVTHVFVQGGVGGLAAGIVSYFWEVYGDKRPVFVVVEPRQADCLYQSAIAGAPAKATGSVDSIMAGLACGESSPLAWRFLASAADYFMTVQDEDAIEAMRALAQGNAADPPIVAGESGAAGLAGLIVSMRNTDFADKVGLGRDSRVLVLNTEGATAPAVYRQLVGESAEAVLARQKSFRPA
jgi:diaminopropionate ammonia-lyase